MVDNSTDEQVPPELPDKDDKPALPLLHRFGAISRNMNHNSTSPNAPIFTVARPSADIQLRWKNNNHEKTTSLDMTLSVPASSGSRRGHMRSESIGATGGATSALIENTLTARGTHSALSEIFQILRDKHSSLRSKLDTLSHFASLLHIGCDHERTHSFISCIQLLIPLLCSSSSDLAAASYRVIRLLIKSEQHLRIALDQSLDFFMILTFTKDEKFDSEKEQALKLFRFLISNSHLCSAVPTALIAAVISLSGALDEKYRLLYLESLCELAIRNADLAAKSGALKCLLEHLADGPAEIRSSIALTLILVADHPTSRRYLQPGVDIEGIFSMLTESYKMIDDEDKLNQIINIIVQFFHSWTGFVYFSSRDLRGLKSIFEALALHSFKLRSLTMKLITKILLMDVDYSICYHLTDLGPNHVHVFQRDYIALILATFLEAGMLKSLIALLEDDENEIRQQTIRLIADILSMSNKLLPTHKSVQVQNLAALFELSHGEGKSQNRNNLINAMDLINKLQQEQNTRALKNDISRRHMSTAGLLDKPKMRENRSSSSASKLNPMMDEAVFRQLLIDSQVVVIRDFTKWNWDLIVSLIDGPLSLPKRLDDVLRSTKFVKRLCSFFAPFKYQFSELNNFKSNQKFVIVGCKLLRIMMHSPEGVKYLGEMKFFPQLVRALQQLDPMYKPTNQEDQFFSQDKLEKSMNATYFKFIGVLSQYPDGISMLEKFRIFTLLYHISELKSRDDLLKLIVSNLSYKIDGHARIILAKILTSGYKHIRLFATNYLRCLVNEKDATMSEWLMTALITQLYDPSMEVAETALSVLNEACSSTHNADQLIKMKPQVDHLRDGGSSLMLKILSLPSGLHYLSQLGYTESEMDRWYATGIMMFTARVESEISQLFPSNRVFKSHTNIGRSIVSTAPSPIAGASPLVEDMSAKTVEHQSLPTVYNLFGELAKSEEGCNLMQKSGYFKRFCQELELFEIQEKDKRKIQRIKAILWTLGFIGSSNVGFRMIEQAAAIPKILTIAKKSPVLSLKGTVFFVISLLGRTVLGAATLDKYGWKSANTLDMIPSGICLPAEASLLLSFEHCQEDERCLDKASPSIPPVKNRKDKIFTEIFENIGNLSNHVVANSASKQLNKLRMERPEYFKNIEIFAMVIDYLGNYHYKIQIRRYINMLFAEVNINASLDKLCKIRQGIQQSIRDGVNFYGIVDKFSGRTHSMSRPGTPTMPRQVTEKLPKIDPIAAHLKPTHG